MKKKSSMQMKKAPTKMGHKSAAKKKITIDTSKTKRANMIETIAKNDGALMIKTASMATLKKSMATMKKKSAMMMKSMAKMGHKSAVKMGHKKK